MLPNTLLIIHILSFLWMQNRLRCSSRHKVCRTQYLKPLNKIIDEETDFSWLYKHPFTCRFQARDHSVNMLAVHPLIILSAVFNHHLYISQLPLATQAYIAFDHRGKENLSEWNEMKTDQLNEINVFKLALNDNVTDKNIIKFRIKFRSASFIRETAWMKILNNGADFFVEEPEVKKVQFCRGTFIVCILILCSLFLTYLNCFYMYVTKY